MRNRATALLSIMLLSVSGAFARQSASATLSGRVTDPQGAVVAEARVVATQKATGVQRETRTNSEGLYSLTNLSPGDYEVKVESQGFRAKGYSTIVLQVGQSATLDVTLEVAGVGVEVLVDDFSYVELLNKTSSIVDGVVGSRQIQSLPLNGRNFLELALLVPGNSPAPNFDPTKTNSVTISSAGQLGRGGSYTIDGTDNNDDVVGGPLENISQDAVQEFQIATNRFSAEIGRSGSSIINIVTKSGSNDLHGSASFFLRDRKLQGLPATFDRSGEEPPFDRQQYSFTLGGPIVKDTAFWFGSFEYRNQDGAVLVGERDTATRTIRRGFAPAPLNDLLGTARGDWHPSNQDQLNFRYSIQREESVAASSLIRPIGSASERQQSDNNFQTFQVRHTRVLSINALNSFTFSVNNFINKTVPVTPGPQLTFPSLQD
ncbi:MAG TPA: carboxypeptidase-like regulatory domain-containing protein, partial [Blastocatellia bacterium]|nr:carboxypeptidase-like regulatory domain-containing protein [Blastocatellia bacterium]